MAYPDILSEINSIAIAMEKNSKFIIRFLEKIFITPMAFNKESLEHRTCVENIVDLQCGLIYFALLKADYLNSNIDAVQINADYTKSIALINKFFEKYTIHPQTLGEHHIFINQFYDIFLGMYLLFDRLDLTMLSSEIYTFNLPKSIRMPDPITQLKIPDYIYELFIYDARSDVEKEMNRHLREFVIHGKKSFSHSITAKCLNLLLINTYISVCPENFLGLASHYWWKSMLLSTSPYLYSFFKHPFSDQGGVMGILPSRIENKRQPISVGEVKLYLTTIFPVKFLYKLIPHELETPTIGAFNYFKVERGSLHCPEIEFIREAIEKAKEIYQIVVQTKTLDFPPSSPLVRTTS